VSEGWSVLHHEHALSLHETRLGNGDSTRHLKNHCLRVVDLYVMANRLQVALIRGVYLVDYDRIRAQQVDFPRKVGEFVPGAVRICDYDFQIGGIERSIVVTSVPQNDVSLFLGPPQNLLVVHSRIQHGPLCEVRFILLALLDRALLKVEVFYDRETLYRLHRKITVIMGCRMTTGLRPCRRNSAATRRETGLLPHPVRTAQTEMTGTEDLSCVRPLV